MNGNEFYECKCSVCKREICIPDINRWAYKQVYHDKRKICCSWGCYRALPTRRGRGQSSGKKDLIQSLLRQGKSTNEIITMAGVSYASVRYWRDRFPGMTVDRI